MRHLLHATALAITLTSVACGESHENGIETDEVSMPAELGAEDNADAPLIDDEGATPPKVASDGRELISKAACSRKRPDQAASYFLEYGLWGEWADCPEICPAGSWATYVAVRSEANQGNNGDDTALNALQFTCGTPAGWWDGAVTSWESIWGRWSPWTGNGMFDPIVGMNRLFEARQSGNNDDTTMNRISARTRSGINLLPQAPGQTNWGTWLSADMRCPPNQAICGLRTRIEPPQGSGDDTALNGIEFVCCWL